MQKSILFLLLINAFSSCCITKNKIPIFSNNEYFDYSDISFLDSLEKTSPRLSEFPSIVRQNKRNLMSPNNSLDWKDSVIYKMLIRSHYLCDTAVHKYPAEGESRPSQIGLAYVWGSKKYQERALPVPIECSKKKGEQTCANIYLHGLDCSGFMSIVYSNSGINMVGNAHRLSDTSLLNNEIRRISGTDNYKFIDLKKIALKEMEHGDIYYVLDASNTKVHIGFIGIREDSVTVLFNSHGKPCGSTCSDNIQKGSDAMILTERWIAKTNCGVLRLNNSKKDTDHDGVTDNEDPYPTGKEPDCENLNLYKYQDALVEVGGFPKYISRSINMRNFNILKYKNRAYLLAPILDNLGNLLTNKFYEFKKESTDWNEKSNFPGSQSEVRYFTTNENIYIGGGSNYKNNTIDTTLWSFNPKAENWQKKKDISIELYKLYDKALYFYNLGSTGYIGNGQFIWEYDDKKDSWKKKETSRPNYDNWGCSNGSYKTEWGCDSTKFFHINVCNGINCSYCYIPRENRWSRIGIPDINGIPRCWISYVFSDSNIAYFEGYTTDNNSQKYAYLLPFDLQNFTWRNPVLYYSGIGEIPPLIDGFALDNNLYLILRKYESQCSDFALFKIKFDK